MVVNVIQFKIFTFDPLSFSFGLFSFEGKLDSDPIKDDPLELTGESTGLITDSPQSTK